MRAMVTTITLDNKSMHRSPVAVQAVGEFEGIVGRSPLMLDVFSAFDAWRLTIARR
jgi:hypothetical protein